MHDIFVEKQYLGKSLWKVERLSFGRLAPVIGLPCPNPNPLHPPRGSDWESPASAETLAIPAANFSIVLFGAYMRSLPLVLTCYPCFIMPFLATDYIPLPTTDLLSWIFDKPLYDEDKPVSLQLLRSSLLYRKHG